jgi:hypothetical protein
MHRAAAMVRTDIVKQAPARASIFGWDFSLLAHALAVASAGRRMIHHATP